MLTVITESTDKAMLPREVKPLNISIDKNNTPFSRMLESNTERPKKAEGNESARPKQSEALHEEGSSKAAKSAVKEDVVQSAVQDNSTKTASAQDKEAVSKKALKDGEAKDFKASSAKVKGKGGFSKKASKHNVYLAKVGKAQSAEGKVQAAEDESTSTKVQAADKGQTKASIKGNAKASKQKTAHDANGTEAKTGKAFDANSDEENIESNTIEENSLPPSALTMAENIAAANAASNEGKDATPPALEEKSEGDALLAVDGMKKADGENSVASAKGKGTLEAKAHKKKQTLDKDEKITVIDLRSEKDLARVNAAEAQKAEGAQGKANASGSEAQLNVNVAEAARQNITSGNTQSAAASSSAFQAMVENSVRDNTPDIVKTGTLLLRDNNTGTINLVMQPENLGNVRIVLHLADNVVSGQITVHSEEAYNAFKNNGAGLSQAFNDSGFDCQGFTLSYSGQGAAENGQGAGPEQGGQYAFMSKMAERGYDGAAFSSPVLDGNAYAADYSVNIVA